jgi:hypothetical protein
MNRLRYWLVASLVVGLAVPALHADVKTRDKTLVKFEGMLGSMSRMFGGNAAKDGVVTSLALKGIRKASMTDTTGEIVDLAEEKMYRLDLKKKEYKVVTFAQLRKEWEDAKAEAEKNAEEIQKAQGEADQTTGKEMEYTAEVKETGEKKDIAGYNAREIIVTVTGREKGKTLEESGGFLMTNTMWLAPRIEALDEIVAFDVRFIKAVYGEDAFAQMQQMATAFAMFSSMKPMMEKLQAENRNLQGTPLQSTILFEQVKSAAQAKAAAADQSSGSGGGGLSGRLSGRLMGGRGQSSGPRSTVFTSSREMLAVETSATDSDVAIPIGFKEKK